MRTYVYIGAVVLVLGVIGFDLAHRGPQVGSDDSSKRAEDYLLVATDQKLRNEVKFSSVMNKEESALVIQEDMGGVPGAIVGTVILPRGVYSNLIVKLDKELATGTVAYATLYTPSEGSYDAHVSVPRTTSAGNVATVRMKVAK